MTLEKGKFSFLQSHTSIQSTSCTNSYVNVKASRMSWQRRFFMFNMLGFWQMQPSMKISRCGGRNLGPSQTALGLLFTMFKHSANCGRQLKCGLDDKVCSFLIRENPILVYQCITDSCWALFPYFVGIQYIPPLLYLLLI